MKTLNYVEVNMVSGGSVGGQHRNAVKKALRPTEPRQDVLKWNCDSLMSYRDPEIFNGFALLICKNWLPSVNNCSVREASVACWKKYVK
jgi:hypothetical protein